MSDPATRVRRLIRAARDRKGWSQADLAHAAGIKSRTTIPNLESGMALREGKESAVEGALDLAVGTIEDVRTGRISVDEALGQPEPTKAASPAKQHHRLESLAEEIEYFRRRLGADDFTRMFRLIDALYHERRRREASNPDTSESDQLDETG